MTAIDIIEYQANYCAAAFLMPKEAVINTFAETMGQTIGNSLISLTDYGVKSAIKETANRFEVNYTAMKYRLQTLKILAREPQTEEYIV